MKTMKFDESHESQGARALQCAGIATARRIGCRYSRRTSDCYAVRKTRGRARDGGPRIVLSEPPKYAGDRCLYQLKAAARLIASARQQCAHARGRIGGDV